MQEDRLVRQRERGRREAQRAQKRHALGRPGALASDARPRHLEHRPHRHARGATVQRVVARRRDQHRVDAERRRRAEHGADVRVVRHVLQHGHSVRTRQQVLHAGQGRALERGQRAARHLVAGQGAELLARGHEHGKVGIAVQQQIDEWHRLIEPLLLHEQRAHPHPGGQRALDHLARLADEQAVRAVGAIAQLRVGHARVRGKPRVVKVFEVDDRHVVLLSVADHRTTARHDALYSTDPIKHVARRGSLWPLPSKRFSNTTASSTGARARPIPATATGWRSTWAQTGWQPSSYT